MIILADNTTDISIVKHVPVDQQLESDLANHFESVLMEWAKKWFLAEVNIVEHISQQKYQGQESVFNYRIVKVDGIPQISFSCTELDIFTCATRTKVENSAQKKQGNAFGEAVIKDLMSELDIEKSPDISVEAADSKLSIKKIQTWELGFSDGTIFITLHSGVYERYINKRFGKNERPHKEKSSLLEGLENQSIKLDVEIPSIQVKLSELVSLRKGDILISEQLLTDAIPVKIAGNVFANAFLGRENEHKMIKLGDNK